MTCCYDYESAENDVCCVCHLYFRRRWFEIHLLLHLYDCSFAQFDAFSSRWNHFDTPFHLFWLYAVGTGNPLTSGDGWFHWSSLRFCFAGSWFEAVDLSYPFHSWDDLVSVPVWVEKPKLLNVVLLSFLFAYSSIIQTSCVFSWFFLSFESSLYPTFHFCYLLPNLRCQSLFPKCSQLASWAHIFPTLMQDLFLSCLIWSTFLLSLNQLPVHCDWTYCLYSTAASWSSQS